ncbi:RHS repeat-associated core domain-containing protein [Curtobacterium flaccumfaciens]|nr:RHS repeat-associated core domain-containing protein [Curtobacterium flaccumfaciens]
MPSLISIADTSLLDLPGGVTAIGDAVTQPAWRSARATDAADPWAALAAVTDVGLPAGVSLTGSGGVSVAGLEWLGARVYDPAARGFLTVDPLVPILGAAWSGNPYSYAGNDPLQAVDPLRLRPATDKDLQAYRDANQGAIANVRDWADEHSELISNIAIGLGVAATVLAMCTPIGPVVAIAVMAGGGAALAGGYRSRKTGGERQGRLGKGRPGHSRWWCVGSCRRGKRAGSLETRGQRLLAQVLQCSSGSARRP